MVRKVEGSNQSSVTILTLSFSFCECIVIQNCDTVNNKVIFEFSGKKPTHNLFAWGNYSDGCVN